MKILLVTGKSAEPQVREIAKRHNCGVFVAPLDVASFLRAEMVEAKGYDLVVVPGLVKADLRAIERRTGIKTCLGPKNLADLDLMLQNIGKIKLSRTVPACEFLKEEMKERALAEISKAESQEYIEEALKRQGNILIGGLPSGRDFPMRVLAEIVDVGNMTGKEIFARAKYYVKSGADIVDLGFNESAPKKVSAAIEAARGAGVPVSVDTMDAENIQAAINAGADLILSFDKPLIEEFENLEIPAVIIPKDGSIPDEPNERLKLLGSSITLARERGFENIIADPILQPVNFGLAESVEAYRRYSGDFPVLMGVGNVTETFDADSVGINALLAGIAGECGASLLFTTEASAKTGGSVRELKTASSMIFVSRKRGSFPKDLGIDLLELKKKR